MKYIKKPKYGIRREKIRIKPQRDLTPTELYEERLRNKSKKRR